MVLGGLLLRDVFLMECGGLVEKRGGCAKFWLSLYCSSLPFPTSSKVLSPFLFTKLEYHPFARSGSPLQGKVVSVRVRYGFFVVSDLQKCGRCAAR